jgi:hypothetical protein
MAKPVRFKWKLKGFKEIRRSAWVQDLVTDECEKITDRANQSSSSSAKYGYSTKKTKTRFRGIVFTDNYKARVDNAKHNTLLKAL